MRFVRALGWALLLLVACYLPAAVVVDALGIEPVVAIPVVLGISLIAAVGLMSPLVARSSFTLRELGLAPCSGSEALLALAAGTVVGLLAAALGGQAGDLRLLELEKFPIWRTAVLFWLGAAIQEELLFRGLLQSVVARALGSSAALPGAVPSAPAALVALLFGALHLPAGLLGALVALLLGILAGELRAHAGSVIPAIIAHAACNCAATLGGLL